MEFKNSYLQGVYETVQRRNAGEPEFLQAVREVLESFEPVLEKRPELEKTGIIDRIVEPERMITFRVSWVDDSGKVQVNWRECVKPDKLLSAGDTVSARGFGKFELSEVGGVTKKGRTSIVLRVYI